MKLLAFAWRSAQGFRGPIARIAVLGFVVALLESATLITLFAFVSGVTASHLNAPAGGGHLLGRVFADLSLPMRGGMVIGLATCRFLLALVLEWRMSRLWVSMRAHMQTAMFEAHLNATTAYLLSRKSGEHIFHIMEGPSFAAVFYLHLMRYLSTSIMLLVLFATLFAVSPGLMLTAVAVAMVYGFAVRRVSERISFVSGTEQADAVARQMQLANEGLAGVRYLKVFSVVPGWVGEFTGQAARAEVAMRRAGFWNTVPARTLEYLVLLIFMALALYALRSGGNLAAAVPTLAVYFLGIVRTLPSLSVLGNGRMQMMQALPNLERFTKLREQIPREESGGGDPVIPSLCKAPVTFEGVRFAYGDKTVFDGIDLTIEPRQVTVILGPSGEGKSTLFDLLLRFVEPTQGTIAIGGRDIREFDLATWRGRIAFLGQDPFLFHGTVTDNICLGRPGASDDDVREAARQAGAAEFIGQLADGWSTVLADRGQSLSGGQRQRIALARALLSGAEVLLLDEPTSALDADSVRAVVQGIAALRGARTIVVVTHSDAFLPLADRVLTLSGGSVEESPPGATGGAR
jgi:ABC-type multidrug transport system fused ATPase/permease subunit